ncbi:MAG: DUF6457 domain-containing protein [Solirubrobacteraceae bacterium]|jgi:hypothetical protein|nr:DUF6457 domain-containing protein [Solirubrobacteraceae bacterium]
MTRDEWLEAFAREIGGATPSADEVDAVLKLAASAAHDSERQAAPVAAWIAGAAGVPLSEAVAAAERVAGG